MSVVAEQLSGGGAGATPRFELFRAPGCADLIAHIDDLARGDEVIARALEACRTGVFLHPDGRADPLNDVRLLPAQLGLLSMLAERCPTPTSVEFGFGMGSSTTVILAARRARGRLFRHIVFDPFGLGGRGDVVLDFLRGEFGAQFDRRYMPSEIGGPALVTEAGAGTCGMVFIDGCHRFENVMADFVVADHLCCLGGFVVFDDVRAPAVECAMNYLERNRQDYELRKFESINMAVLQKIAQDEREWSDFQPFQSPTRSNWDLKA